MKSCLITMNLQQDKYKRKHSSPLHNKLLKTKDKEKNLKTDRDKRQIPLNSTTFRHRQLWSWPGLVLWGFVFGFLPTCHSPQGEGPAVWLIRPPAASTLCNLGSKHLGPRIPCPQSLGSTSSPHSPLSAGVRAPGLSVPGACRCRPNSLSMQTPSPFRNDPKVGQERTLGQGPPFFGLRRK